MRGTQHAFFEQSEFERLFRNNLLQVTGLAAQVFDLVGVIFGNALALEPDQPIDGKQFGLRFGAAVCARCSGDKSDKEESAGCFGAMGIVAYCCVVLCIEQRF